MNQASTCLRRMRRAVPVMILMMLCAHHSAHGETEGQRDDRMRWWREAKFGMFVHWGLYAVPAGTYEGKRVGGIGEWIMKHARIPVARYANYAKDFNPIKFDADAWVSTAKQAGMTYIVITAKHHDGFAMYPSKASAFNIVDATPFKRDPLAELAAACRKQGIKLGFYYSQAQDWHHPGGGGSGWDPAQQGSMLQYVKDVAAPQVTELLTNYGPDVPAVLWWDTPYGMTREMADLLIAPTRARPDLIQNNRLGGGYPGDTETPEQKIPAQGFKDRDWETCMTMNGTWGYKSYDDRWKSTGELIRNLIDIASKGGNYLLNVGPTAEGLIPQASVDRLREIGNWLRVNGESIYGTKASPFPRTLPWGRATRRDGRLYAHVFVWPEDGRLYLPLTNKVQKATLLAKADHAVAVTPQTEETDAPGIVLSLPQQAPDPIVSVLALDIEGAPQTVVSAPLVRQAADGDITLPAALAELGAGLRLETLGDGPPNIGYWKRAEDTAAWRVLVRRPGRYDLVLQYACAPDCGGAFVVEAGGSTVQASVTPTGAWSDFEEKVVGHIAFENRGQLVVSVRPVGKPEGGLMNLRKVVLRPAEELSKGHE